MKVLILGLISILTLSCSRHWDFSLWEQKIENSSYSIYKFNASGGRDSMISGIKILDTLKGFSQNDVTTGHKLNYLLSVPTNNQIIGIYRLDDPSIQSKKIPNIENFNIDVFGKKDGNKSTLEKYKFKSFNESKDSIVFYKNVSVFIDGVDCDKITLPKGNVYLFSKDFIYVEEIVVEKIVITSSNEIIYDTKSFIPINKTRISEFSDYGIFKPINNIGY